MRTAAAIPFLGIGIAFLVIGWTGHRTTFEVIGAVFLVLAFLIFARRRKDPGPS